MTFGFGSANFLIDNSATVAQIIGTTLKLWLGEWFLAKNVGIPWTTQIIGRRTLPLAILIIRTAVLNVPGVVSIGNLTYNYDTSTRILSITINDVQTLFSSGTSGTGSLNITVPMLDLVTGSYIPIVNVQNKQVTVPL